MVWCFFFGVRLRARVRAYILMYVRVYNIGLWACVGARRCVTVAVGPTPMVVLSVHLCGACVRSRSRRWDHQRPG